MGGDGERRGYMWAIAAGSCAALAAVSAKFFSSQLLKYGLVVLFNVIMWGCYVNSLKALSSLQATVTNFATNFLSSGLAGYFLFEEPLSSKWFAGALFIVLGVFILSKSSVEKSKFGLIFTFVENSAFAFLGNILSLPLNVQCICFLEKDKGKV